ncbi:intermembrane lipid transfer protein VPS13C-like isoform X5 [Lineus longissimus]|uniref:intermembrane lipid transfer protein VPS13C-like isoform X5 n=1 Tax=Lineus longissimus TaxID=88925 RepID=UPI00315D5919
MVFESIIVDLLNKYLGDYVENLDKSQLKLGIWGGDIVLQNLDVKQSALDDLNLPVTIKHGHLGKLVLKIPWKNLYTAPVIATIDGLYVLAVPNLGVKYDAEKEEKSAQEAKQKDLRKMEEAKQAEREKDVSEQDMSEEASPGKKKKHKKTKKAKKKQKKKDKVKKPKPEAENKPKEDTFAEKLATQIIKNLQVRVSNIHVRYEDRFTNPKKPFSIGVTLHDLNFQTCDENWKSTIVKESVTMIFKMIQLDSLALYWNSKTELIADQPRELQTELLKNMIASSNNKPNLRYLLKPIYSKVQLTLNTKPENQDYSLPKVFLNIIFEEIAIHLGKLQYHDVLEMLESFERMALVGVYRKYGRPVGQYHGQAKQWWRYAHKCVMEETVRRRRKMWSWICIQGHRRRRREYKDLWKKKILNKKFTSENTKQFEELEAKLDVFNITMVRQQAEMEAKKEAKKSKEGGWFGGWFGGGKKKEAKAANEIQEEFYKAMTSEEKQKLYGAIGYQEGNQGDSTLPKDYVAHKIVFKLNQMSLSFDDSARSEPQILQLMLHDVYANIGQRPSADGLRVDAKMDTFSVTGCPIGGVAPAIVSSQNSEADRIFSLLDLQVEVNPLDGGCDTRLRVSSRPLEVVYDANTIINIVEFFKPPESVRLKQLTAAAMSKFDEIKEMSATGMQHAIEIHKYTDISIDLKPVHVIIPQEGVYKKNANLVIVELGSLKVSSEKNEFKQYDGDGLTEIEREVLERRGSKTETIEEVMERAYDKFNVQLSGIQVLFAHPGDSWEFAKQQTHTPMHILRPMSLDLNIHKSIIPNDTRMPKIKIGGELPLLSVNISDRRLEELLVLALSIPLPEPLPPDETVTFGDDDAIPIVQMTSAVAKVKIPSKGGDSSDEDDADGAGKVGDTEEAAMQQCTDLELKFEVKEISLNLSQTKQGVDVPTLKLVVESLGTMVQIRTFDMRVEAYLGGMYVQHQQFKALNDGPLVNLVNTPITDDSAFRLLLVEFIKADRAGPEFSTVYHNTEQQINVQFTALEILLHQEAILNIKDFAEAIVEKLEVAKSMPKTAEVGKDAKTELTKDVAPVRKKARRMRKQDEGIIQLKVQANLDSLSVSVCNMELNLTDIKIKGLDARVALTQEKTDVKVALKDITVLDPAHGTVYPKILSIADGEVLSMGVTVFNDGTEGDKYELMQCVDTKVTVQIGCIQVVFLNKFVAGLLLFANKFQEAKDKIAEASDKLAETAQEQAKNLHEKAMRIGLDVTMKAPVILMPQNSTSAEVLCIDFGVLTLNNTFAVAGRNPSNNSPAILDKMRIELTELKVLRAVIEPDGTRSEVQLLQPVTINISVIRNLSVGWFHDKPEVEISGRLAAVTLALSEGDFAGMMKTLTENLAEGEIKPEELKPAVTPETTEASRPRTTSKIEEKPKETVAEVVEKTEAYPKMALSFTLENLAVVLYTGDSSLTSGLGVIKRDPFKNFAKFQLDCIIVSMDMKTDNSMSASVDLHTCLLDDIRPGAENKISRMIERSLGKAQSIENAPTKMIEVLFSQTATLDKHLILNVNCLYICVCLEFLVRLGDFFTKGLPAAPAKKEEPVPVVVTSTAAAQPVDAAVVAPPVGELVVQMKVIDPEIILIEDATNMNTQALILDTQASFQLRQTPEVQTMMGSIQQLQIYTGPFDKKKRKDAKIQILNPLDISFNSSAPFGKDHHMALNLTDVILNISPNTIQTMTKISTGLAPPPDEASLAESEHNYFDLWDKKKIADMDFWFLNPPSSADKMTPNLDVVPMMSGGAQVETRHEQLMMSISSIVVRVEAGVGKRTVPMLIVEAGFNGEVKDWSKQLSITAELKLEVAYYNERIAMWEPLLEPVEDGHVHRPWELALEIKKNDDVIEYYEEEGEVENIVSQPPKMSMELKSYDILQLTLTKSCLEVLTLLGKAFADAYNLVEPPSKGEDYSAPYVLLNHSGMPISVKLDERFQMPAHVSPDKTICMQNLEVQTLHNMKKVKKLRKVESICQTAQDDEERKLILCVETFAATRELCIQKSEMRSFNINQQSYPGDIWALVCETESKLGCKIVTMRSVIQVKNQLPHEIELYYKTEDGIEMFGSVAHDAYFNIPLHVVHTARNHLFFKPKGDKYKISSTGLSWRSLKNQHPESVMCDAEQAGNVPFFFNIIPNIEDVFFEATNEKNAKVYTISIHPTVVFQNHLPMDIDYILKGTASQITLKAGERTILYNACAGKSSLEVRILNYLGKDWDAKMSLDPAAEELSVWTFEAKDGYSTVTMDLGVHMKNAGFLEMSLYSPYWMVNKTGLPLQYKMYTKHQSTEEILFDHPEDYTNAVLFSFKPKSYFSKKKVTYESDEEGDQTHKNKEEKQRENGGDDAPPKKKKSKQPWKKSGKETCYHCNYLTLKVCESEFSDKFSIDTVGSSGTISCKFKNYTYEVGVKITLGGSGLTKIVVFSPYYMLVNKAKFTITAHEITDNAQATDCPPLDCVPFWPINTGKKMQMRAKVKDRDLETTPFLFNEAHSTLMKLEGEYGGINVECQVSESTTIVVFEQYNDGMASVLIVNQTQCAVSFNQAGVDEELSLDAGETCFFTWQDALGKREFHWRCGEHKGKNELLKDDGGDFFADSDSKIYWITFLDGLQRVMLLTQDQSLLKAAREVFWYNEAELERVDQDIKISLQGMGLSLVNNYNRTEVAYLGITSSGVVWEEKKKRYKALKLKHCQALEEAYQRYQNELLVGRKPTPRLNLAEKLEVDFAELMMYKPSKRPIRRSFENGIFLQYRTSPHQVQIHAKVHRLQLDSQLPSCVFQTILSPISPPKSVAAESVPKPFTEMSVMLRKNEHSDVMQFRYFHLLTQEMAVKVDQGFLIAIIGLFASSVPEADPIEKFKEDEKIISTTLMESDASLVMAGGVKNFYDDMHFSPLKIHISFSLQGDSGGDRQAVPIGMNVINLFLQSVGVVLTDVQDVVFKLGFFERKYAFYTQNQLVGELIRHYSSQAIKQMYVLVLGLDVLGNPFGVIRGVAQGLEDLFYEPYQGAIQGPEEFAEGLALGVRSLFGHAIGGAAGAVSRITGTVGKGLATLTMDDDYQKKRREQMNKKPENVREGLARGGKGLVMGVFDGVTGIVTKPVKGAKEAGVEGFFKGVGKGLVGVVTRPASGVVDFASSSFEAVRRVADTSDEIHRLRPPRYLPPDGIVRPYMHREAEGNNILQETEKGKFANDKYVGHMVATKDMKHVLLVTNKRVIMVSKGELFGQWDAAWFYTWNELKEPPTMTPKGIQIVLKEDSQRSPMFSPKQLFQREKQKKLFGSSTVGKVVQALDEKTAEWLVEKIHEAMLKYREGL